ANEEGKAFDGFARDAEEWLVSHAWPGNVRELENLVRQVVVLKQGGSINRSDLPAQSTAVQATEVVYPSVPNEAPSAIMAEPDYGVEPLWMTEKRAIERAIALCRGNVVAAAKQLQINPSTIYRKKAGWEQNG
ncbi:MAG: helix-turn-helix domain-containing protein, partial [Pseudomonadota bacterium]